MPEDLYHLDPVAEGSISSTGVKEILRTPAHFAWYREHGRPDKTDFELGRVFHSIVLGTGAEYVPLPFDAWTTKDAKAARAQALQAGLTPLKTSEWAQVQAMVAGFRASPLSALLDGGIAERSMFWRDEETGVWCRGRLDLSNKATIVDLKTSKNASKEAFRRDAANYGYHDQYALYLRGVRALRAQLGIDDDVEPEFIHLVVEKTPPYLTAAYEFDRLACEVGDARVTKALKTFRDCQATGLWPGYPVDIQPLSLPSYATWIPDEDYDL